MKDKKIKISPSQKERLRQELRFRQQIRDRKKEERRKRYFKGGL